jgi:hypothetical protein
MICNFIMEPALISRESEAKPHNTWFSDTFSAGGKLLLHVILYFLFVVILPAAWKLDPDERIGLSFFMVLPGILAPAPSIWLKGISDRARAVGLACGEAVAAGLVLLIYIYLLRDVPFQPPNELLFAFAVLCGPGLLAMLAAMYAIRRVSKAEGRNCQGVWQDYVKAREWYADKGDERAMADLGWLYASGRGVAQDYVKAREWYEKAADKGDAGAKANLGSL